jgi:hypothetical protein
MLCCDIDIHPPQTLTTTEIEYNAHSVLWPVEYNVWESVGKCGIIFRFGLRGEKWNKVGFGGDAWRP